MSLHDRIRKNLSTIPEEERNALKNAFIVLNTKNEFRFPGKRDDKPFVGGVSYWFKQDEIHQATHVHGGPAFLTWHRELCNRLERLLRMADHNVSLHYWNWNEDPKDLFNDEFMGDLKGEAGEPWLSAGFYNPYPIGDNYRGIDAFDTEHSNPADPPIILIREKQDGTLKEYAERIGRRFYTDEDIIKSTTYNVMRTKLERVHNLAHNYIGGTIGDAHTAFRDPFIFLLHSNVDRLFAAWQLHKGFEWRLKPEDVYGEEENTVALGSTSPYVMVGIKTLLSPWCGIGYPYQYGMNVEEGKTEEPGVKDVRPWTYPENWHRDPTQYPDEQPKNSLDDSVVIPPLYDKFPDAGDLEYNYHLARRT